MSRAHYGDRRPSSDSCGRRFSDAWSPQLAQSVSDGSSWTQVLWSSTQDARSNTERLSKFFHQCDCSERFWFLRLSTSGEGRQHVELGKWFLGWLRSASHAGQMSPLSKSHSRISHGERLPERRGKRRGQKGTPKWLHEKRQVIFVEIQLSRFAAWGTFHLWRMRWTSCIQALFRRTITAFYASHEGGSGTWIVSREQQYGSLNSTVPSLSTGDIAYKLVHCSLQEGVPCLFWGSSMSVPKLWVDPIKLATRLLKRHRCSRRFSMPVYRAWACLSPLSTEKWNCSVRQL